MRVTFLCVFPIGFVDIFSKNKDRLGAHASKILKFLHRNRIPSSAIPFPILEGYNSICTMRSSVVQDYLELLLQKEKGVHQKNVWLPPDYICECSPMIRVNAYRDVRVSSSVSHSVFAFLRFRYPV